MANEEENELIRDYFVVSRQLRLMRYSTWSSDMASEDHPVQRQLQMSASRLQLIADQLIFRGFERINIGTGLLWRKKQETEASDIIVETKEHD